MDANMIERAIARIQEAERNGNDLTAITLDLGSELNALRDLVTQIMTANIVAAFNSMDIPLPSDKHYKKRN